MTEAEREALLREKLQTPRSLRFSEVV